MKLCGQTRLRECLILSLLLFDEQRESLKMIMLCKILKGMGGDVHGSDCNE
jgi:hypothetical protein